MKRLVLILACLGFGLSLRAQDRPSTNEVALARPVYRYLFLIDTSSTMSRQKAVTLDTVSRLILSGMGGRIRIGNAWNLWTFDDGLDTNAFPAQLWDPRRASETAKQMQRFLSSRPFNKKKASLDNPLAAVAEEAKLSGALTVFLFTDGSAPVKGTPFDDPINEVFAKHAAGMRKAKKPFVAVLVSQDGKFAAHGVTPGGETIYIPRLPNPKATAKSLATEGDNSTNPAKSGPDPDSKPAENAASAQAPPKKALTVEEISEAMRQSQKPQTNTGAATPVPLIIRAEAKTNEVAAGATGAPAGETPAPTPAPSAVASNATAVQDQSGDVTDKPFAAAPAVTLRTEPSAPPVKITSAPPETSGPPAPQQNEEPAAPAEPRVDDTRKALVSVPAAVQAAVLAQPEPSPRMYLIASVALLLVALLLAWLYIRSIRYVPRSSLISRSMAKEKIESESRMSNDERNPNSRNPNQ